MQCYRKKTQNRNRKLTKRLAYKLNKTSIYKFAVNYKTMTDKFPPHILCRKQAFTASVHPLFVQT